MRRLLAVALACLLGGAAWAQQDVLPAFEVPDQRVASTILTVDIDLLFQTSAFGERIGREYTEGRAELATENRRIAEALREEELALAAQRDEMDADVFRTEADAFDAKAQAIRRAQDAKEQDLEDTLSVGREQFLEVSRPILGQMMIDRGAYAILDRRSVLLAFGSIDITEEAVAQINSAIGDGSGTTRPRPEPAPEGPQDN